jgi:hypothetical protein
MTTTLDVAKRQHAAGGYTLYITNEKGNTRFSDAKKKAIIEAVNDSWTEGVYITSYKQVIRQLLNGVTESLQKDNETGEFYFTSN